MKKRHIQDVQKLSISLVVLGLLIILILVSAQQATAFYSTDTIFSTPVNIRQADLHTPTFTSTVPTVTPTEENSTATATPTEVATSTATATPALAKISGRIVDQNSHELPSVNLVLNNGRSTSTDSTGWYTFTSLVSGTYILTPALAGYVFMPITYTVQVPPDALNTNFQGKAIPVPVVFIPGFAASHLLDADGNYEEIWPGLGKRKAKLSLDPEEQPFPDIIASDAMRRVNNPITDRPAVVIYGKLIDTLIESGNYEEYDVGNDPERRSATGCDTSQAKDSPSLFVYAYDWRLDNVANAELLEDYVGCIQQFYPNTSIDIVAHSMGGLLARRYILDNPGDVRKLITIGTPWLGAPKTIDSIENGETGFPLIIILERTASDLLEFFPAAHHLLPTAGYFELGGQPFYERDWDANRSGTVEEYYQYRMLMDFMDIQHPRSLPGTNNRLFHTASQDDWRTDQSGVEYLHIYGTQRQERTLGLLIAAKQRWCIVKDNSRRCEQENRYYTKLIAGDGTVPTISASRMNNGLNLNASHSVLFHATPLPGESDKAVEHTSLAQNDGVLNKILEALSSPISSAHASEAQEESSYQSEPALYLSVFSANLIAGEDSVGNKMAITDDYLEELPSMTYIPLNDTDRQFVLSNEIGYRFELESDRDIPTSIEISRGTGDRADKYYLTRYVDVWFEETKKMELTIGPDQVTLRYDNDENGTFETIIEPTTTLEGDAASDTNPPTVQVIANPQGEQIAVTILAADNMSGVHRIFYSFDGNAYELYENEITVDVTKHSRLYVEAVDFAGNSSRTIVAELQNVTHKTFLPIISK